MAMGTTAIAARTIAASTVFEPTTAAATAYATAAATAYDSAAAATAFEPAARTTAGGRQRKRWIRWGRR